MVSGLRPYKGKGGDGQASGGHRSYVSRGLGNIPRGSPPRGRMQDRPSSNGPRTPEGPGPAGDAGLSHPRGRAAPLPRSGPARSARASSPASISADVKLNGAGLFTSAQQDA